MDILSIYKKLKDMSYEVYYLNYKFTTEMREEVKKIKKYLEKISFICKYKLGEIIE